MSLVSTWFWYFANFLRDPLQVLADHHPDSQVVSLELQALVEAHHPQVSVDFLLDSLLAGHLHQASLLPEDKAWASRGRKRCYDGLRNGGENPSTVSALRGVGLYIPKIVTF
jgi:hypothetical protein